MSPGVGMPDSTAVRTMLRRSSCRCEEHLGKLGIQHEVRKIRLGLQRLTNIVQQTCSNNAAAPPDARDFMKLQSVIVRLGRGLQECHSLRVCRNHAKGECVVKALNKCLFVAVKLLTQALTSFSRLFLSQPCTRTNRALPLPCRL